MKKVFICIISIFIVISITFGIYNIFIRTWISKVDISTEDIAQLDVFNAATQEEAELLIHQLGDSIANTAYPVLDEENLAKIDFEFSNDDAYANEINFSFRFYDSEESFKQSTGSFDSENPYLITGCIYIKQESIPFSKVDFNTIQEMQNVYEELYGRKRPIFDRYLHKGIIGNTQYFISPIVTDSKHAHIFGAPFLPNAEGTVESIYEVGSFITIKTHESARKNSSKQKHILHYLSNLLKNTIPPSQ